MDQSYRAPDTLDLRDYLAVLRRQRWLVVGTVVVVLVVAMGVTLLQTPVFESTSELVVEPLGSADDQSALEQALFGQTELETQRKLVTSVAVAERVIEDVGLQTTPEELLERIDVRVVNETQILEITAQHTDPERAAQLAQAFATGYLADRREEGLERVLNATAALEERARTLRTRIDDLAERIQQAETSTAAPTEPGAEPTAEPTPSPTDEADVEVLRRERDSLLTQLGQVTAQAATFSATDEFIRGGGRVIVPATVPESPSSPKPLRTGVLALVLGAMLGVGLAFLRDHLDDVIRSEEDTVRAAGRPIVGRIPETSEDQTGGRLVTLVQPFSPASEAYRSLRTNVRFITGGSTRLDQEESLARGPSLAITSAAATEGKTTTAANLAVAAARAGTRVLLIDADLRRSNIHKVFGLAEGMGLSDLLVGEAELRDVVVDVGVPNLRVMPSGRTPPNPTELLSSPAMRDLHDQLSGLAELVIYDCPPVLAIADALEVSPLSDHTLLVVYSRQSHRRAVRASVERLEAVGVAVDGCILNAVDAQQSYYYTYGDYAGGETPADQPPAKTPPTGTWGNRMPAPPPPPEPAAPPRARTRRDLRPPDQPSPVEEPNGAIRPAGDVERAPTAPEVAPRGAQDEDPGSIERTARSDEHPTPPRFSLLDEDAEPIRDGNR